MTTRVASCCCGQLKVTCEGEPVRASMCHCFACQQRTGSVFGVQARWPQDKVQIEGVATEYVRTGDSGGKAKFRFCPTCGSTLVWEIDKMPGFFGVAVGGFADPSFVPPKVSIYEARRHKWTRMPDLECELID